MSRPVIQLTSLDNPRIKLAVRLQRGQQRRRHDLLLVEGPRLVGRALDAGLTLRDLFVDAHTATAPGAVHDLLAQVQAGHWPRADAAGLFEVTSALLAKMAYRGEKTEGIVGLFEPPDLSTDALAQSHPASAAPLWLIAVGLAKPGNLGAMARSAAAAGADALLVADAVVDPFNPNALRASTGAVFALPVVCDTASAIIDVCRQRSLRIIAASPDAPTSLYDLDLTGPTALVIGPEDVGLDATWRDAADALASIPMAAWPRGTSSAASTGAGVDSLNASVAAGVMLFEAVRQRRGGLSHNRRACGDDSAC